MHRRKLLPLRNLVLLNEYRLFQVKVPSLPDLNSDLHFPTPRQSAPTRPGLLPFAPSAAGS
jgi:hypothetical protein